MNKDWWENPEYLNIKKQLEKEYPGITNSDLYYNLVGQVFELGQASRL